MQTEHAAEPWYKQFWPWFIIAIPVITVVANLWFIQMSLGLADSKVKDSYYKDGLAINKTVAADEVALKGGLTAELELDAKNGLIRVQLPEGAVLDKLTLAINHPMEARYDMVFGLERVKGNLFEGRAPKPLNYPRWYLDLTGTLNGEPWRMRSEWNIALPQLTMEPQTEITVAEAENIGLEDRMAARYKVSARVAIDSGSGGVSVELPGVDPSVADLSLVFRHATDPALGGTVLLNPGADGRFEGSLGKALADGNWIVELSGTLQQHQFPWRLKSSWRPAVRELQLSPLASLQ